MSNHAEVGDLFDQICHWQISTFGIESDVDHVLLKLEEEYEELKANPGDGEEMADVITVLVRLAYCHGVDLKQELANKLDKNKTRQWARTGRNGIHRHVE